MRWSLLSAPFGALLLASLPVAADDLPQQPITAREVIAACSKNAVDDIVGLEKLAAACPGLPAALQEFGMAEQLSATSERRLNVYALDDILALHDRYSDAPIHVALDSKTLQPILNDFKQPLVSQTKSLWERFKAWLRELFDAKKGETPSWLEQALKYLTVPANVLDVIVYAILAAVVILAVGIVVMELRAAGVLIRRGGRAVGLQQSTTQSQRHSTSMVDIDAAPLLERPALLLRLLVSTLIANRQLTTERGLTHRELPARALFALEQQRQRFQRLSRLAERIRYGRAVTADTALSDTTLMDSNFTNIEPTLLDARALHDELQRQANKSTT